jgi:hypothetical protein
MENILNTTIENFDTVIVVLTAIITVLGVIVKLTPSKEDDKYLDIINRGFALIKRNVKVEDLNKLKKEIENFKKKPEIK